MSVKLEITQSHIDDGVRTDATLCPIALALKSIGYEAIQVGRSGVYVPDPGHGNKTLLYLSTEATQFVHDFDHGFPVEPCTLELKEA